MNETGPGKTEQRELDNTDRRLIGLLQKDGRISNTDLARRLGISEATVRLRLKKLIDGDVIQIVGVCNPFKIGFGITGDLYIHVDMRKTAPVIDELAKFKELWYIVMTTGQATINAEFVVGSLEELNDLVYNRLSVIDGIARIETSIITKYIKRRYDFGTGSG